MTEPRQTSFVALLRKIREEVSAEDQDLTMAEREERIRAAVEGNPLLNRLLAKAEAPERMGPTTPERRRSSRSTVAKPSPRP